MMMKSHSRNYPSLMKEKERSFDQRWRSLDNFSQVMDRARAEAFIDVLLLDEDRSWINLSQRIAQIIQRLVRDIDWHLSALIVHDFNEYLQNSGRGALDEINYHIENTHKMPTRTSRHFLAKGASFLNAIVPSKKSAQLYMGTLMSDKRRNEDDWLMWVEEFVENIQDFMNEINFPESHEIFEGIDEYLNKMNRLLTEDRKMRNDPNRRKEKTNSPIHLF